jgi:hypothetical protein
MEKETRQRLAQLPVRDRVAEALQAAEHAIILLSDRPEAAAAARAALDAAWRWRQGSAVRALTLYDLMHEFFPLDAGLEGQQLTAYQAIGNALFYTTWHAVREEVEQHGPDHGYQFGNDICEGDEEVLYECLDHAARITPTE